MRKYLIFIALLLAAACGPPRRVAAPSAPASPPVVEAPAAAIADPVVGQAAPLEAMQPVPPPPQPVFPVRPGIEVLRARGFDTLRGLRVGLVTNPSGVDHTLRSTIDILYEAPEVNLVALYGPEHGVRGDAWAGDKVTDSRDARTGLPVFSLYGPTREPTPQMLEGVDIMVYDIQDVGTRSYTFISTLGLVMRACARKGIPVMVLDRPNPLGGNKIEGPVTRPGFFSFVGQFAIPYVYGLTVGELAVLINEEGLNCGQKGDQVPLKCALHVVPMEGWKRDMLYNDTGLPWVLPSPNIPYPQSAIGYPSSGIAGEFSGWVNIGIGYNLPFCAFGAEWIDADALVARLESYRIPGVAWRPFHFRPFYGSGSGKLLHGVQFHYTDYEAATITLTQFWVMQALGELYPDHQPFKAGLARIDMLNKVCGTDYVSKEFGRAMKVSDILSYWSGDVEAFRALAQQYYMY